MPNEIVVAVNRVVVRRVPVESTAEYKVRKEKMLDDTGAATVPVGRHAGLDKKMCDGVGELPTDIGMRVLGGVKIDLLDDQGAFRVTELGGSLLTAMCPVCRVNLIFSADGNWYKK